MRLTLSCAASVLAATLFAPTTQAQTTWLINEVSTLSDYVELINCSSAPADPSGLCLWSFETRGNSVPCSPPTAPFGLTFHYEVPAGTPPVPPLGTFVIHESLATPCGVVTGSNIFWFEVSDLIVWINTDPTQPNVNQLDMVCLGDIHQTDHVRGTYDGGGQWLEGPVVRPNDNADAVYRPATATGCPVDTNTAKDWRFGPSTESSPCMPNPPLAPNPLTFGTGYSVSGNCAASGNTNTCTELPTLTITDGAAFAPNPGGGFDLTLQSGAAAAPFQACLLFGVQQCPGIPFTIPGCSQPIPIYVDLATAGTICNPAVAWDACNAGVVAPVAVPNNPGVIGVQLCFQGFAFELGAACPIRSTNGVCVTIEP